LQSKRKLMAAPALPTGLLLGEAGSREIPAAFFVYDEEKVRRKSSTCPTKLFIGGISRHTTTKQLRDHFSQYGEVLDCIAMRAGDGRPRGFGYVTLDSPAAAQRCLYEPQLIDNRVVDMKLAVPEVGASPKNGFAKQAGFNENMLSKYGYGAWSGVDMHDSQSWWPACPSQVAGGQFDQGLDCLQILSLTRESGALSAGAPEFVPYSELTSPEATPTSRSEVSGQQRAPLGEITNVVKADDEPKRLKPLLTDASQLYSNVPTSGSSKLLAHDDVVFHIHEDPIEEVQPLSENAGKSDLLLSPLKVGKGDLLLTPLPTAGEVQVDAFRNDGSETSDASDPSSDHDYDDKLSEAHGADLDNLPSIGSALHFSGECKRCNFFAKGRCQNGKDCSFCHLPHEVRKLTRQEKRERRDAKLQELTKDGEESAFEHRQQPHHQLMRPTSLTASLFANGEDDEAPGDDASAYSSLPGFTPVHAVKLPSPSLLPSTKDVLKQERPALPPGLLPPGLAAPPSSSVAKDQTTPELLHVSASKPIQSSLLSTTPSPSPSPSMVLAATRAVSSALLSTTPSSITSPTAEPQPRTVNVRTVGTQTDDDWKCPRCEKRLRNISGKVSEENEDICCASLNARCGGC
jgi:hypothetical protein